MTGLRHRISRRGIAAAGALALSVGVLTLPTPLHVDVASAAPVVPLTFLNINDFHGRIDTNTVKWAGTIESLRAAAPGGDGSTALLAAGDNISGSLFASSVEKDQPTIDVLNALELDASSVGNHEFDRGFADLTDRVIAGGTNAKWPYLAANVYGDVPALPEYTVLTMGPVGQEIKVGVIGAVTSETPQLVSPGGVSTLTFGDPVEAVNRVADQLTDGDPANGEADILVAEYHEGASEGTPDGFTFEQELAAGGAFASIVSDTSPKVAAIFTGHTHKQYAWDAPVPGAPGTFRPIVQTGSYGDTVGKVVLNIDRGSGTVPMHVDSYTGALVPRVTTADGTLVTAYPRVAAVKTIVDAALANAAVKGNVPVGSVTKDITRAYSGGSTATGVYVGGVADDRSKESTIGNLVANALVAKLSAPAAGGATIGVVNPGGLRNDLLRDPDSVVTVAEATAILPFANSLFTISLTGAQFKTMLEQQWQRLPNGTVPSRPYLQLGLSDNVTYTFDSTLAEGSRITSITVNGSPIDPSASYRIGTFSFLTDGGDNFRIFTQGTNKKDSGLIDADAWIQYITTSAPVAPNFARHSTEVTPIPTTAVVGQKLNFKVSSLDLTSLGSPINTTLKVSVGGVDAGTVPVVAGAATVNVTVPAGAAAGAQKIVLTALPTNTTVTIPVTVVRTFSPDTPTRLFDTRAGESPDALKVVPKAKIGGATTLEVKVTDLAGLVPAAGVGAVSLNLTAVNATVAGFVTAYPCGDRPGVSSVNYTAGQITANSAVVPVSATGTVCFFSSAPVDLVVDVSGWFATGSGFTAVSPKREFDTRAGQSSDALISVAKAKVGGTKVLEVKLADIGGVPATGVGAVSLNVTAVNATLDGYLTVYPCGERKLVSSVNYTADQITSNGVITPLSATGTVCFFSQRDVDLVVDVNGWFATGSGFTSVSPDRVFDTRAGDSPAALRTVAKAKISGANVLEVKVTDLPGLVPATGVGAVSLNVTAVNGDLAGFVTVYPCGTRGLVSSLNVIPGKVVSNSVIAPVSATGTVCFYSQYPVDVLADVNGWFAG